MYPRLSLSLSHTCSRCTPSRCSRVRQVFPVLNQFFSLPAARCSVAALVACDACPSAGAGAGVHRQLPRKLQVRVVRIRKPPLISALSSRFLMGLIADLSSQVASAEAAAVAARSAAESLLKQACVVAPHHRLIHRDCALLSSPAQFEPDFGSEQLGESELRDAARLARDSLSMFPMQVNV